MAKRQRRRVSKASAKGRRATRTFKYSESLRVRRIGDGKDKVIWMESLVDGEWVNRGAHGSPYPLYRLDELEDAASVLVVEGEKCVEAVRALGFIATTSICGSQASRRSDWSPLRGKDVVVIPDEDEDGEDYLDAVAGLLGQLTPPP